MLQGRARALAMLARLQVATGAAERAQKYKTEALAALEACRQAGVRVDDQPGVFRKSYAAPVWLEPWKMPLPAAERHP